MSLNLQQKQTSQLFWTKRRGSILHASSRVWTASLLRSASVSLVRPRIASVSSRYSWHGRRGMPQHSILCGRFREETSNRSRLRVRITYIYIRHKHNANKETTTSRARAAPGTRIEAADPDAPKQYQQEQQQQWRQRQYHTRIYHMIVPTRPGVAANFGVTCCLHVRRRAYHTPQTTGGMPEAKHQALHFLLAIIRATAAVRVSIRASSFG